jgi:hypothetical protein
MKKTISIILFVAMLFCFVSCSAGPVKGYTDLKNNETLVVAGNKYFNSESSETKPQYLTYTKQVIYTLNRSSYASSNDAVQYNSYYYYWTKETVTEQEKLGELTIKTKITYDYLTYGEENVNVNVRKAVSKEYDYSYDGGFVEKQFSHKENLRGYFTSLEKLEELCPELLEKIDTSGKAQYYVDVVTPEEVTYETRTYTDTYFYFE